MDNLVKHLEKVSLSGEEIMRILDNQGDVIKYSDLANCQHINDVLEPSKCLVILYESKHDYGHFCALTKRGNCIEFFDPYGLGPDKELRFIKDKVKLETNQWYPYLSHLLDESGYRLVFNNIRLQKYGNGINTCGRWCAVRCLMKKVPLQKFIKMFTSMKCKTYDPDYFVTMMTMFI